MKKDGWKKSKINQGWSMTKVEGQEIVVRNLKWWERILLKFYLLK